MIKYCDVFIVFGSMVGCTGQLWLFGNG